MAQKKPKAGNGKGKDDDFDQGGPDGPKRLERERNEQGNKGDNIAKFDGAELKEMLETIRSAEARIRKRNEETKAKNAPDREIIRDAKATLVESNYPASVLGAIIRKDKLLAQAAAVDEHFDEEAKEVFATMEEALGQYSDTELGRWAIAANAERGGEPATAH